MATNDKEKKIDDMEWTLFDRFLYGGLGHGYFCLPTNLVRILFTVIFPPIATIMKHLKMQPTFPYITPDTLTNLLNNIDDIIYSFVLTALFYIPGLIYGLSNLKCAETSGIGDGDVTKEDFEMVQDLTMEDIKNHFNKIKRQREIKRNID
jgi:uncharacterized membrane protein YqaE (UPF0057 family)